MPSLISTPKKYSNGKAGDFLVRDAHLYDVPEVEDDPAVFFAGALQHRQSVRKGVDHGERHELIDNFCAIGGSIFAKRGEGVDHLGHGSVRVEEIADFDVPRAQGLRGCQQVLLYQIRFLLFFAGEKPIAKELELDVFHAVVVEDAFDFRQGIGA